MQLPICALLLALPLAGAAQDARPANAPLPDPDGRQGSDAGAGAQGSATEVHSYFGYLRVILMDSETRASQT
jgi:hypothetical protein